MVKPIVKDPIFLARKSVSATAEDSQVAQDLQDTLEAHREGCVGMAANMIGVNKRIMPLPQRHAKDEALPEHQGPVSKRAFPAADQDLHRLDGPDHPA